VVDPGPGPGPGPGVVPSIVAQSTPFLSNTPQDDPVDPLNHTSAGGPDPAVLIAVQSKLLSTVGKIDHDITVDYGIVQDVPLIGESLPVNQGVGTSPVIRFYLLLNPPSDLQPILVGQNSADNVGARYIQVFDLINVKGVGAVARDDDQSSPKATGSFDIESTQENSLIFGQFGHRGTPSIFNAGGGLDLVNQGNTGGTSETADISYITQSRELPTVANIPFAADWSNPGRWQGLAVELLGSPGLIAPVAVPLTAEAETDGPVIQIPVTVDPDHVVSGVAVVSGGGVATAVGQNVEFVPPSVDDVSVVTYTLTNDAGSSSSTITITTSGFSQGDPPTNITVLLALPDPNPGGTPTFSDTGEEAS